MLTGGVEKPLLPSDSPSRLAARAATGIHRVVARVVAVRLGSWSSQPRSFPFVLRLLYTRQTFKLMHLASENLSILYACAAHKFGHTSGARMTPRSLGPMESPDGRAFLRRPVARAAKSICRLSIGSRREKEQKRYRYHPLLPLLRPSAQVVEGSDHCHCC